MQVSLHMPLAMLTSPPVIASEGSNQAVSVSSNSPPITKKISQNKFINLLAYRYSPANIVGCSSAVNPYDRHSGKANELN